MATQVMPTKTEEAEALRAQLRKQAEAMNTARNLVDAFREVFQGKPIPAGVVDGLDHMVSVVLEVKRE